MHLEVQKAMNVPPLPRRPILLEVVDSKLVPVKTETDFTETENACESNGIDLLNQANNSFASIEVVKTEQQQCDSDSPQTPVILEQNVPTGIVNSTSAPVYSAIKSEIDLPDLVIKVEGEEAVVKEEVLFEPDSDCHYVETAESIEVAWCSPKQEEENNHGDPLITGNQDGQNIRYETLLLKGIHERYNEKVLKMCTTCKQPLGRKAHVKCESLAIKPSALIEEPSIFIEKPSTFIKKPSTFIEKPSDMVATPRLVRKRIRKPRTAPPKVPKVPIRPICQICRQQYATTGSLKRHIGMVHSDVTGQTPLTIKYQSSPCEICKKVLSTPMSLKRHMMIHNNYKPFRCNFCGVGFTTKCYIKRHIFRHLDRKPYNCHKCRKGFIRKEHLIPHVLKHFGVRPYKCRKCRKGFWTKHSLTRHLPSHTLPKKYACTSCDRTFSAKQRLIKHSYSHRVGGSLHSDRMLFKCFTCDKSFSRKGRLIPHVLEHIGVELHKCPKCTRKFSVKSTLLRHISSHDSPKKYGCASCDRRFSTKKWLIKHSLTHRAEEGHFYKLRNRDPVQSRLDPIIQSRLDPVIQSPRMDLDPIMQSRRMNPVVLLKRIQLNDVGLPIS